MITYFINNSFSAESWCSEACHMDELTLTAVTATGEFMAVTHSSCVWSIGRETGWCTPLGSYRMAGALLVSCVDITLTIHELWIQIIYSTHYITRWSSNRLILPSFGNSCCQHHFAVTLMPRFQSANHHGYRSLVHMYWLWETSWMIGNQGLPYCTTTCTYK